jgi:archaemetzincin
LDDVLRPNLPDDAAALIAFTASDLWPGKGWNFVYGQASLRHRVGIWSINRNGDPGEGEEEFKLCLRRTLKTAAHETGHMFSIKHCIAHECNMCGRNNRAESDRSPLYLCPQCVAKVCWATETDVVERYQKLARFCNENSLAEEEQFYSRSIAVLQSATAYKN